MVEKVVPAPHGQIQEVVKQIRPLANSMGMRLPLPVGLGKARMFNDVTDEECETAFVEWERLCKPAVQP